MKLPIMALARWTARLAGTLMLSQLLSAVVVIVIFGGGDAFDPLAQLIRGKLLFAAMLPMAVGLVVAWKWEVAGGLLTLGGLALLADVTGDFPPSVMYWATLAVGLLYVGCGWVKGRATR